MLYYQNYEIPEKDYLSSEESMCYMLVIGWQITGPPFVRLPQIVSILLPLSGEGSIMSVDSYLLNYIDVR